METIKVILNPYAGRGNGDRNSDKIRAALEQAGCIYDIQYTTGVGHAIELARQARLDGYKIVVAAGGDGTVSEVVNGLAMVTPPIEVVGTLAIFPIGSGNDFADMAGCPGGKRDGSDLYKTAVAIAARRTRCVDLAWVSVRSSLGANERFFVNNIGAGFEGQVNKESRKIKRLSGVLLYLAAVFQALRHYQLPRVELDWEAETGDNPLAVINQLPLINNRNFLKKQITTMDICNSPRTGGGFYLTPDALLDDGVLDLFVADAVPVWRLLTVLPKVMLGTHTNDEAVSIIRCRSVRISCLDPLPVHVDGELISEKADELDIQVQPGRLEVIV